MDCAKPRNGGNSRRRGYFGVLDKPPEPRALSVITPGNDGIEEAGSLVCATPYSGQVRESSRGPPEIFHISDPSSARTDHRSTGQCSSQQNSRRKFRDRKRRLTLLATKRTTVALCSSVHVSLTRVAASDRRRQSSLLKGSPETRSRTQVHESGTIVIVSLDLPTRHCGPIQGRSRFIQ